MTLPPIGRRITPQVAEPRSRKAESSSFSVPEPRAGSGADVAAVAVTPTSLLTLQAESEAAAMPARSLSAVAGGAMRNLDGLQLALLRADRIPAHLLAELAEAAAQLELADPAAAAAWQPLLMRIKIELARHSPDTADPPLR